MGGFSVWGSGRMTRNRADSVGRAPYPRHLGSRCQSASDDFGDNDLSERRGVPGHCPGRRVVLSPITARNPA